MNRLSRFKLGFKALRQLGPGQLGQYVLYQLGLRTGHHHQVLSASLTRLDDISRGTSFSIHPCLPVLPDRTALLKLLGDQINQLYAEADEIVYGQVRLFGGPSVPLELALPTKLEYWTKYETANNLTESRDSKYIWEPGRFGWTYKLAMAYVLSQDERYADAFWLYTGRFLTSNLPYDGPHWSSAQEVAIRLIALVFASQIFTQSKGATPERLASLAQSVAVHAERIPPTLSYARSQNNNHLISEALGLYTASAALPDHPLAPEWHSLGWRWLIHALRTQISADGTYIQHSTNYHRLMLQAALWAFVIHDHSFNQEAIPSDIITLLEASTRWLWKLVDPDTGQVPNLGHNDGSYILPLSVCPSYDYRPVIHAAAKTFLHTQLTPPGAWDDMSHWLCRSGEKSQSEVGLNYWHQSLTPAGLNTQPPYLLINHQNGSWGTLRVAHFHSRPAHADQLHLDLWWRGHNLALDPGTYLYTSPPPWENSLTSACVHNTVVVDGRDLMQRAGKFLYLDWAQGRVLDQQLSDADNCQSLTAEHNGYRKIRVWHRRKVTVCADGHWEIIDQMEGPSDHPHTIRLHWLLPDWEYEVLDPTRDDDVNLYVIRILSPSGWLTLKIGMTSLQQNTSTQAPTFQLARAGTLLFGAGQVSPITGWTSPTYGDKIPALASILEVTQTLPVTLISKWILPSES